MPSLRSGVVRARIEAALVALVLAAMAAGMACAGDAAAPAPTTAAPTTVTPTTVAVTASSSPSTPWPSTTAATTLPEPVPGEAGVGGVTSPVDVCRDWSRLTGSYLLLTVAAGFGGLDRPALDRLEVAAAPVVAEAAASLLGSWPAELAAERAVVADGVVAPLDARARRALAALDTAGLDAAGRAELAAAWLQVLATQDRTDPVVALPSLSPAASAAVDAAAAELAGQLGRVDLDPALARAGILTPLTDAYLLERCPEAVELVGTDAV
jgi:hypothetical protein